MTRFFKYLICLLPYLFVFIASLYLPRDPDLGWHLKYGEYFFQHHHILRENTFSTTMVGYQWANGSWGTDIVTYVIYHFGGFLGLIVASALIVTLTFFIFARTARFSLLEEAIFFPILVYLEWYLNDHSFRGQQISMLLLGVLFFILSRYATKAKTLWLIPLLFLFWVNLQAESFLGVVLFDVWVGLVIIQSFLKDKKLFSKENIFLIKIFIVTVFVTFLNPYGWGIHLDSLSHIQDPLLKKVNEYVPFPVFTRSWWNEIIVVSLLLGGVIYIFYKKKLRQNIVLLGIPLLLILLAFNVRRYVWPGYYLLIPFLHMLWQPIEKYTKKYGFFIAYVLSLSSIAYIGYIKTPFSQFSDMSWDTFCHNNDPQCTAQSAEYLQKNKLTHNLFTFYDWGGWLIWNYPAVKPSIDGRMHQWKDKEGKRPIADYDAYMQGQKNIDSSSYDVIYIPLVDRTLPLYIKLSKLINKKKWKVVYEDEFAGIIERVK